MIDRLTVERKIAEARGALDQLSTSLADREGIFQALLSSTFLAFAAPWQVLKKGPAEQLHWINQGLSTVGAILALQGATRYGHGRKCTVITISMAQKAVELAKKEVDGAGLLLHLGAGRDAILSDRLLEFAVASILLNPEKSAQAAMMSMANEMIAGVLRSGWLERNVVKIQ